ncbi:hypothetical protein RF11_14713 [Thelohanellus kitauei]|uniref:Uncharacterized protein n=1 Tax=Thelohanellus kitauei TaxID=669202 RepID=A0A0C2I7S7_THEKT|nr:hypothetical protein RF11_14713 [Thelohanellus kitauei]
MPVFLTSDAAKAYSKAAKLAEFQLFDYHRASLNYIEAALCLCNISNIRACPYFTKSIESLIYSADLYSAIFLSMRCGYIYGKKFFDFNQSRKYFKLADRLRLKYDIDHKCILTNDDFRDIRKDNGQDISKWRQIIRSNKTNCRRENKPLGNSRHI